MLRHQLQLSLLHAAMALTAVPADSTLNRVMKTELSLSATLIALLVSLPYLFAPIQVAIGSFADRNPIMGRRRTPYILIGILLSVAGVFLAPTAVFAFETSITTGILLSLLAFGLWGTGFNFATVSYFSLATELSGEDKRSQTISIMYFVMLISVITIGITISRMVEPYSAQAVTQAVYLTGGIALLMGLIGIIGLEPPMDKITAVDSQIPLRTMFQTLTKNPQAKLFFGYLILLLAAILGQDVILEPFGGEALGLTVSETSRLTSIYGGCFLITLVIASFLERWLNKIRVANLGSWSAIGAFIVLVLSGFLVNIPLFYLGVVLLGLAIGVATVSNHSLMLDMTTIQNVGLFIGAWGMATAFARLVGSLFSSVVIDFVSTITSNLAVPYLIAFGINIVFLFGSLRLLQRIQVSRFHKVASETGPSNPSSQHHQKTVPFKTNP
ncbi:MAG: BCD family MFS transporter [Chloroflexota bacterium]